MVWFSPLWPLVTLMVFQHLLLSCHSRNLSVSISDKFRLRGGLQRSLARSLPLPEAISSYAGTHNSFNTESKPILHTNLIFESPRNQRLSVYEQLELGARFLEIDFHYIQSQERLVSCHISSSAASLIRDICESLTWEFCNSYNIFDFGDNTGCPGDAPLAKVFLDEILQWLDEPRNQNEVITVLLDFQGSNIDEADAMLKNVVDLRRVLTPSERATLYPDNPDGWPSIDQLVAMGKHIVFVGFNSSIVFPKSFSQSISVAELEVNNSIHEFCHRNEALPPFFRVLGDATSVVFNGTVFLDGPEDTGLVRAENVTRYLECGLLPAFDRFDADLAEAMIWSWAVDEPKLPLLEPRDRKQAPVYGHHLVNPGKQAPVYGNHPSEGKHGLDWNKNGKPALICVVMERSDLRWHTASCSELHRMACRRDHDGSWALGQRQTAVAHAISRARCCPTGYAPATPRTARENARLQQVVQRNKWDDTAGNGGNCGAVWLSYVSVDGGESWSDDRKGDSI